MIMRETQVAAAIANLARMGLGEDECAVIIKRWLEFNNSFSVAAACRGAVANSKLIPVGLPEDCSGQLFMSCHFGPYVYIPAYLGLRTPSRRVSVMIGEESDGLKSALSAFGKSLDVSVSFISGGIGIAKALKKALAAGDPVFVAIDIPWGAKSSLNREFAFVNGTIQSKDALFRLARSADAPTNFLLASATNDDIMLTNYGERTQEECFAIFSHIARNSLHQYERLFQLHHFTTNENSSGVAVTWRGAKDRYILNSSDMKVYAVGGPLFDTVPSKAEVEAITGEAVEYVAAF